MGKVIFIVCRLKYEHIFYILHKTTFITDSVLKFHKDPLAIPMLETIDFNSLRVSLVYVFSFMFIILGQTI